MDRNVAISTFLIYLGELFVNEDEKYVTHV